MQSQRNQPAAQVLKLRTWLDGRQTPQVFKPEAQAKELAGIALESSFACASGFDKRGIFSPFSDLDIEMRNFKEREQGFHVNVMSQSPRAAARGIQRRSSCH
jgi:hypothetical protein